MAGASNLMPRPRGFCAVALVQPKTSANVGSVLRLKMAEWTLVLEQAATEIAP